MDGSLSGKGGDDPRYLGRKNQYLTISKIDASLDKMVSVQSISLWLVRIIGGLHCPVLRLSSPKYIPCFHAREDIVHPVPLVHFAWDCTCGL